MRATIATLVLVAAGFAASCSGGEDFESGAGASGGNDGGGASGGKAGSSSGGKSGSSGASGSGGSSGSDGSGGVSGSSGSGGDSGSGNAGAGGGSSGGASGSGGSSSGGTNPGGAGGSGGTDSGGAGGTGGSSTGGSGGTDGGTGGSTGSGGSGGTGGGAPCNWNTNSCPNGTYCNALGCNDGTCTPFPNPGINKNPVCGCDGITYWNASVAGSQGMSAKSIGECSPGIVCGGIAGIDCPAGYCNYELPDALTCDISHATGTCWMVPSSCSGGVGFGPNTRGCDDPSCTDQCKLISSGVWYYVDNDCPQ